MSTFRNTMNPERFDVSPTPSAGIPLEAWLLGIAALIVGAGSGFAAGLYYARMCDQRAFQQARTGINRLFQTVVETMDCVQQLCVLMENMPGRLLKPEQTEVLVEKRTGLLESLTGLITRHSPVTEPENEEESKPPDDFHIEWRTEPVDGITGMPNHKAFHLNMESLLSAGRNAERTSGVLLVRVDKMDSLRSRIGNDGVDKLIKKLTGVVCRAVRDEDLVCRYGSDTLGILFPNTDDDIGRKLAGAVRDSVRIYRFRVEETGAEVFMTASFGYTPCRLEDNVELVLNRAADALSSSERRGRNQLHVHDGASLTHCLAG